MAEAYRTAGAPAPPEWMQRVTASFNEPSDYFRSFAPPAQVRKHSAVLMLFGPRTPGADELIVVLTERAAHLRAHPGQVSFPGGTAEPDDRDGAHTALREAEEEVGVQPASVNIVSVAPPLYLSPTQTSVEPVLGWWAQPHPISVVDASEVARVVTADVAHLLDPANRFTVTHPLGYRGPGFDVDGLFIWGFTAMLLSTVFDLAGLTQPWDDTRTRPIRADILAAWMRRQR